MAYLDSDKDKDKDLEEGQPSTGGASGPATLDGGGATPGSAGGSSSAPAEPSAPGGSAGTGNFVGLKQYLDANKTQSQDLANNLGGYVQGATTRAQDTLNNQTGLYNQDVDKNTVGLDKGVFDQAKSNAASVASDQDKKASFIKMKDANYAGPQSLETSSYFNPITEALDKAASVAGNTKTEGGQKTLINQYQQDTSGKQGSVGATNFDQLLLQSGGGKDTLAKAAAGQQGLAGALDQAKAGALQKAQQAAATTAATKAAIMGEFGGAGASSQQTLENQLKAKANQQIVASKGDQDAVKNQLLSGAPLSDQTLQQLGMTQDQYKYLQGLELKSALLDWDGSNSNHTANYSPDFTNALQRASDAYYSKNLLANQLMAVNPETRINAQNVASADDYARYAALNDLMGTQNSFLSDPSQAGKAVTDNVDLNYQGAKSFLESLVGINGQGGSKSQYYAPIYNPEYVGLPDYARKGGIGYAGSGSPTPDAYMYDPQGIGGGIAGNNPAWNSIINSLGKG